MTRYMIQEVSKTGMRRGPVLAAVSAENAENALYRFTKRMGRSLPEGLRLVATRAMHGMTDTFTPNNREG